MRVVIGSDHGGFAAKAFIKKAIQALGHEVVDFGCHTADAVDYPDVAQLVAEAVVSGAYDKGVLIDGFGGAVCMAANKVPGARAVAAYDSVSARMAAQHDDANVLCIGGKSHGELIHAEIVKVFFGTPFEGGRHEGRLAKVAAIEKRYSR
jgi:ribose 5-phosphate isomerase B